MFGDFPYEHVDISVAGALLRWRCENVPFFLWAFFSRPCRWTEVVYPSAKRANVISKANPSEKGKQLL